MKNARKRQVEEEREEEARKIQRKEREGKQFRESRVETPSHTGGVSEEALKREEERRNKGGRGLKVKFGLILHFQGVFILVPLQKVPSVLNTVN